MDAERKHGSIEWNRSCETSLFSLESDSSRVRRNIRVEIGGYRTMIGWRGSRLCREWELIPPRGIGGGADSGEEREREEEEESAEK